MSNAGLSLVVLIMGMMVSAAGVYLGVPAWRLSRHAVSAQTANEEQARFNRRLAVAITGEAELGQTSPDHPSLVDAIGDLAETMRELAIVSTVLAYHLAEPHGGDIPRQVLDKLG